MLINKKKRMIFFFNSPRHNPAYTSEKKTKKQSRHCWILPIGAQTICMAAEWLIFNS